ncbi:transposase DDE domain protein [Mycobacterium ulcerans str. Harvey]|uniref:Transposase DDE domain protein n=2 Tax=Mycobacterium ulcerans str. Harvey TaxID=1299332 RepID=A0ABN0QMJ7_MYCUL|nr:transposase DDE domain protein [Mycobacterium ulcerans str. Harvey]
MLGQLAVAEKSNEIPCVRALLTLLPDNLRWLVTVDAMHTQVVTAKLICATLKSHYLMIVKSNQAKILARITALPWAEVPAAATDDSRGHGRVETRTLQIITAARGIGFPYAKQIIRITRERLITATDQRSVEVVYAICSLPFEHARPTAIMTWMRQHCGIENSLHWIRDVTFDEDRHRAHTGHGAQVLATLRNTAINLHRLNGADNIAEACRITALTANRRLDLLNPQFPAHKPANQQRRSPAPAPSGSLGWALSTATSSLRQSCSGTVVSSLRSDGSSRAANRPRVHHWPGPHGGRHNRSRRPWAPSSRQSAFSLTRARSISAAGVPGEPRWSC